MQEHVGAERDRKRARPLGPRAESYLKGRVRRKVGTALPSLWHSDYEASSHRHRAGFRFKFGLWPICSPELQRACSSVSEVQQGEQLLQVDSVILLRRIDLKYCVH